MTRYEDTRRAALRERRVVKPLLPFGDRRKEPRPDEKAIVAQRLESAEHRVAALEAKVPLSRAG